MERVSRDGNDMHFAGPPAKTARAGRPHNRKTQGASSETYGIAAEPNSHGRPRDLPQFVSSGADKSDYQVNLTIQKERLGPGLPPILFT